MNNINKLKINQKKTNIEIYKEPYEIKTYRIAELFYLKYKSRIFCIPTIGFIKKRN